jgi:hypothetical protein
MTVSEWLDAQEAQGIDVSQIDLPEDLSYDAVPDETIYFNEFRPCSILCPENHPYATVERFGRWYMSRGQDKTAGIHSTDGFWHLFTKDRDLAVETARSHVE